MGPWPCSSRNPSWPLPGWPPRRKTERRSAATRAPTSNALTVSSICCCVTEWEAGQWQDRKAGGSLAVRLLEQLLQAGVSTRHALSTLSSALALRGEDTGGFTTVDLLQIDLFSGEGELFKLGAAPTYVKKGSSVQRLSGSSLPAGLAEGDPSSLDHFTLRLAPGDCVLMVSDGICGSPKDLARELITHSPQEATDDRTALVVRIEKRT